MEKKLEATEVKLHLNSGKKTHSTLIDDNKLCEWKMKALKEEIGTAERIQSCLMKS